MADYTSSGTGTWGADATWGGGGHPGAGDNATVANGHVVTLDSDEECAALTIDAGGEVDVGAYKITLSGVLKNDGTFTGGAGGEIDITSNNSSTQGTWDLQGASGNPFTLTGAVGTTWTFKGALDGGSIIMRYVSVTGNRLSMTHLAQTDVIENLTVAAQWRPGYSCVTVRGFVQTSGYIYAGAGCDVTVIDGDFGGQNIAYGPEGGIITLINCDNNVTSLRMSALLRGTVIRSLGEDGVEGAWRIDTPGGSVFRSTAAKKTGDYGIEMVPDDDIPQFLLYVDIPIPVETGDTVAPSLYVKNETADLDLQDAADRMVFELDPGDEWGLNEEIDANTLSDVYQNWRQVSFTGGTAGGSSDKGTVLLRVWLKRYVASGVVYLADPDFDSDVFATGSLYGPIAVEAGSGSGGGLKLVGCGGLAG